MSDEKYLEFLYKGYNYSTEQFDKAILFVSSGALGLSITMIEKIVPLSTCNCKGLLLFSWVLEICTILLFTINHLISIRVFSEEINLEKTEKENEPKQVEVENKERKNNQIKSINQCSIFTLIAGILFLVIFIFINI